MLTCLCAEQLLTGGFGGGPTASPAPAPAPAPAPLLKKAPHVFKALYETDLLPEELILSWHACPRVNGPGMGQSAPGIRVALLAELRAAVAPFVAWLQEAEEDSDEE